jgi:hypothetical protein
MTMLYLMGNPTAYGALVREIREADASGFISSPVRDVEARSLPYLQAVLKEGLRVFPPVTGLMSVVVPPGGEVMHGMNIPAGTEIGWTAFGVLRSKGVFGPDADVFRPERWLDAHPDQHKAMTAQWELVFKYGKWQCLGKTVALLELNKVFVEVSLQQIAVLHILSLLIVSFTALPPLRLFHHRPNRAGQDILGRHPHSVKPHGPGRPPRRLEDLRGALRAQEGDLRVRSAIGHRPTGGHGNNEAREVGGLTLLPREGLLYSPMRFPVSFVAPFITVVEHRLFSRRAGGHMRRTARGKRADGRAVAVRSE